MLVTIYNPDTKDLERSFLSAYTDKLAAQIDVKNNEGFATTQAIMLGQMGNERTEMAETDGTSGNTVVTLNGTTGFGHDQDEPVYILDFNAFKIYRAAAVDDTKVFIETIPVDVNEPDKITKYDDPSGLSTSYYWVKHYNTITGEESDYSDPIPASGYPAKSLGRVIDAVVRRIGDIGFAIFTIDEYIDIANEVNYDLTSQSLKPYRFQKDHEDIDTVAGQNWIPLPTRLWKFDYVMYSYTSGGQTRKYKPEVMEFEDWTEKYEGRQWASTNQLQTVAIDEETNRLYLGPTPLTAQTGKIRVHFYQYLPEFDSWEIWYLRQIAWFTVTKCCQSSTTRRRSRIINSSPWPRNTTLSTETRS